MADAPAVVHIGENSPEQVAYRLTHDIASIEKRVLHHTSGGHQAADRKWLLDTYAECLKTVRDPFSRTY
jgi:hypothetical protein